MTDQISLRTLHRPAKPNNAFVVPDGIETVAERDLASPEFAISATELFRICVETWSPQKRVNLVHEDSATLTAAFVATTALMRFKDDIYLEVVAMGDARSSLLLYSGSRVGYSDLGVNRKRVDHWLNELRGRVENP